MASRTRTWRPPEGVELAAALWHLRRGSGDPTYRIIGGTHWRGVRTPEGPATVALWQRTADVGAEAWGPGAGWLLDRVPDLLGAADETTDFAPTDPVVAELRQRHGTPRFGRTQLVMEALVPAVLEQKVTGQEAFAGFRHLVRRFGERAPGPGPEHDLWVQPTPAVLRQVPSWEWLKMRVDPARSRAVVTAARVADSLERTLGLPGDEVERRLTSLPGIGEWTAAEVRQRAHGDPDAVSFGDYHVAKDVGWALTGSPWEDEQLRAYLDPFRPHRRRVVTLIYAAAGPRPRRGPRMAPRTHLPG